MRVCRVVGRGALALAVGATSIALSQAGATAQITPTADQRLNSPVSGTVAQATHTSLPLAPCPGDPQAPTHYRHFAEDGTYVTSRGRLGTYHLDQCEAGGYPTYNESGTFLITTPQGATVTGTFSYPIDERFDPPTTYSLEVTGGTRRYRHVTGTIDVTVNPSAHGTFTGHIQQPK